MNREISVVAYDAAWSGLFEQEKVALQQALGTNALEIHHMGSTSVEGLAAKPILDILIAVHSLAEVDGCEHAMTALGYEAKGENGIPGRRYFRKGGARRTHHIHVFRAGDAQVLRHLAFRDYLRAHPDVVQAYAGLKMALAAEHWHDAKSYQAGKDAFIGQHETLALAWYTRR
ncbi:GrpB family protein [Shewanella cyperi]|uniref:GrpB family protein n=1 Tax=Shewanella cyperi TaxID=2814292 RepID=A0A975AM88_9GAMM|nr:GrpB family protein [Shewanella cyperi]QSX31591.1 GrpB family protein [Shewanella cyperi]